MADSQDAGRFDTIIIGCGMAGLAAGIRLALFEKKVLILEKHNAPGGLNSFYFKDGRKYDVGLHAVTNYPNRVIRPAPLAKLCRQLRIPLEAFNLSPQAGSRIAFPGVDLRFGNSVELLQSEVERVFSREAEGFRKLRKMVLAHDATRLENPERSAREAIRACISDPLLEDMLLCPLMYYGSAREKDIEFDQFVTLWKAIYEEGFGRPLEGVRIIIKALVDKYRELGGQRRMRCGVRRILIDGDRATGVETEKGEILLAETVISTAGRAETEVLCGKGSTDPEVAAAVGRLSFAETISVLDHNPVELGCTDTIVFFNDSGRFHYEQSVEPVDLRSGVICFPNNYQYPEDRQLEEGLLRVTVLANHAAWAGFDEATYAREKEAWFPRILSSALRFLPGMEAKAVEASTVARDMFTPRTVEKFTSHFGGAVYGSPDKLRTGETGFDKLYLAGTDQGFLGIVGAMLSGISMANRHVLAAER